MPRALRLPGFLIFMLSVQCFLPHVLQAGDWPQIFGPQRNGIAQGERIARSWSQGKPKTVWQRDVGEGYAGVAVSKGMAILFHRVENNERVEALDATTGQMIWISDAATTFNTTFSSDNGPRCVPIIHKERVYVYGSQGVLRCLELKSGTEVWSRDTHKDFRAPEGYFGASSTPIVEGNLILVNVGSRNGAGIVAFSLENGNTVWQKTNEYASYSSPVAATIDGVRHVIFITRMKTISLNPENGDIRFEFPFGKRGPTVNAASPTILGGNLFVSAHYGLGARLVRMTSNKAELLWESDAILSSHYTTCIADDGKLYGIHGQERVDLPELRCFDPNTQKVLWTKPGFGYGTLIKAGKTLIAVTTTGDLILLKPNSEKYDELARASIFDTSTRALPALSNGLLYVRDTKTLKCLDLR